jgi:hypothetical protein
MPLVPSVVLGVLVIVSSSSVGGSTGAATQDPEKPGRVRPWPCRLVPASTILSVIEKGMERSETIRRQCDELAAAQAVVVLEWGAMDSQTHARTGMAVRDGLVVATVQLPPLGDTIVLMAHELQHVIEKTRGLDFAIEAKRSGSGVWRAFGGYETQAAVDVSRQVAKELKAHSRAARE